MKINAQKRNHLDQNYKLSPHRLIFDGGVGAQQSAAPTRLKPFSYFCTW
jgi:hypothetical protein